MSWDEEIATDRGEAEKKSVSVSARQVILAAVISTVI